MMSRTHYGPPAVVSADGAHVAGQVELALAPGHSGRDASVELAGRVARQILADPRIPHGRSSWRAPVYRSMLLMEAVNA